MGDPAVANLLALIDSTEDMWGSVDLNYRMVVFNKNFERYMRSCFGLEIKPGSNPMDLLPPERAAVWPALFERALKEGPYRSEHVLLDGRTFEMAIQPILEEGNATGVSVYGRDITDRKRTEMQLRDSEEQFRSTFEQAAIGILHTSFQGDFIRCNPRFSEITGYSQEELAGLKIQQITAPDNLADSERTFESLAHSEAETARLEKRYLCKDGRNVWAKLTISKQYDGQGRPLHFITFVEEIDQRKAAEQRAAEAAQALRLSEERYRAAFETSIDAVAINRLSDGMYVDVNRSFLAVAGCKREDVIGRTTIELGVWVDLADRARLMEILRRQSYCRGMETRFRKFSGDIYWAELSASVFPVDGVDFVFNVTRDITATKAAEKSIAATAEALRVTEERYRTVFQTSLDGITLSRMNDGHYIDVNKSFLSLLGYEREEIIGHTSREIGLWVNQQDRQMLVEEIRKNSSVRDVDIQYKKKNGEALWSLTSSSVIEIDGVTCLLSIIRDVTEAKAAAEKIEDLAFFDPLTRLPNRRLLMDSLRQALTASFLQNRKCALLMVDLDNLKTFNDNLGHHVGDQLLQEVARRLSSGIRETDLVARLGGDEFAVLLRDLSETSEHAAEQARHVGEKLLAALAHPCVLNGRECVSTSSIGITIFGDRREEAGDLLQQADIANDQAKLAGRNTLRFFSPQLRAAASARATLEEELRQAIRNKQFELYYQPQISRGQLFGAEALIRWRHPQRGIVAPNIFIPVAEETGMILELGNWVLETACEQIAAWARNKETAQLAVAVNISALQFRQPEFEHQVLAALKRTGADPRNLKLELTESMLVDNIEEVIAKMSSLRSREIAFSLDDFGTGYSSLSYLKRLPLNQLKIDRSFVRDILTDSSSGAIAEAIISLGRAMDLKVIAEGVETEEQRVFLARLGCHAFQGYLTSRPLPVEEFQTLLSALNKIAVPYVD
jgi:diguanylate cyclase (GGDEF)-like protein/PAS domain S-box-containing protein